MTGLAARTYVALVHYPVYDRNGRIVTTAITNLDIHDIARATRTFGLAGYFIVTPIAAQRELVSRIIRHWTEGAGREHNEKRTDALETVRVVKALDEVQAVIRLETASEPCLVATGARPQRVQVGFTELRRLREEDARATVLLFGTGWGLAEEVLAQAEAVLAAIRPTADIWEQSPYNHLSVRAAVAIVLDRLFGDRDPKLSEVERK